MKKLLFMVLFPVLLYGQLTNIPVVGSTTDLSAHYGRGLIILNTDTDGGFFIAADSTYSESGTYAYAHPVTGLQWVRLGYAGDAMGTFYNLTIGGTLGVTGASTFTGGISGALNVDSYVAGIDSFWLELTTDTINITGVTVGDIFTFSEYCPDYSTAVDTVTFSYKCETGRVLVTRSTAGDVSAPSYKSVGKYAYIRMK